MIGSATGLLLLAAATAYAQEAAPSGTQRLTLQQALAMADDYNPQLRVAGAVREGAQAAILTARAYPNPEFNLLNGNQRIRMETAVGGLLNHYSVSQQLDLPGVRRARILAAEMGKESSEYTVAEARLAVRGAVKQAFFQVLRRRGEIELARENLKLVEDLRFRIQKQVSVGEAARLELVRADAELATARNQVRSAQLREVAAVSALRAAISAPLDVQLEPEGALDRAMILPTLDELRAETLAQHPSLALARAEVRRAEARLQSEKAQRTPQPVVRAEFERQPDLGFYRLGVSIPLPVLNRREGPIAEAVALLHQARANEDVRRLELTAALERAYGQYQVASQQMAAYEQGVLREAEAALSAAESAFKFGERGILEVLDAQRVLRGVRTDLLNAQFDRQAALIELEQLRALDPGGRP